MNVESLIKQHPLLTADLRNLGLTNRKLHAVADDISTQLSVHISGTASGPTSDNEKSKEKSKERGNDRGNKNFNLCYILNKLSCREFVRAVDTKKVAEEAEVSPALAQAVVMTIAPWVDKFQLRVTP